MSEWGTDVIRHKYAPLPEDAPRHRKKAKKHHTKSDHRHVYETVCIDTHSYVCKEHKKVPIMHVGRRCKICGRLSEATARFDMHEAPNGMRVFEVADIIALIDTKYLTEEMEVPF